MKVRHKRRAIAMVAAGSLLGTAAPLAAATPTHAAPGGKVAGTGIAKTSGTALNMRRAPSSGAERVGSVANGGTVWIMCQTAGETVTGTVRATNMWDRLANNTYVSDAYVVRGAFAVPACAPPVPTNNAVGPIPPVAAPMPPVVGDWQLPVAAKLVSGFHTAQRPTHDGVDLGAVRYTPIRAAAAGTVNRMVCNVSTNNCDVDGSRSLTGCGWYVEVQHPGRIVTRYCHMVRRPLVNVGDTVVRGQTLGYVGTSGASSGPHLHFEVHLSAPPATRANAVDPIAFMQVRGLTIR